MEAILLKQKRKQLSAFVLGLLGLIAEPSVNALETFKPYAGFDVQQRTVKMVPGFGEGLFDKRVPQGNVYAGFNFHEYFGIEIGQQFTQGSTRTALTPENELLLGQTFPVSIVTKNNLKMQGSHANIVGNIPLPVARSQVLLSAGMNVIKIEGTVKVIDANGVVVPINIAEEFSTVFSSRRIIPQFSAGLGFAVTNDVTLRLLTNYEITSQFKNIKKKIIGVTEDDFVMSLKNSLSFGVGLNFKFK